jgi:hypothetical protein
LLKVQAVKLPIDLEFSLVSGRMVGFALEAI